MQIDSADIFHAVVPLSGQQRQAAGRNELHTVLVRLTSGEKSAWGEAPVGEAPRDTGQWAAGVFLCLKDWLVPAILGQCIESGDQLQEKLREFAGNSFAKAALDVAWWSLHAEFSNQSLAALLGATTASPPQTLELSRFETIDDLIAAMRASLGGGIHQFHLQLSPGWDLQVLRAVRNTFSEISLSAGFAGQLSLNQRDLLYRLEDFHLTFIEQPFDADDLVGQAMLQESLRTPLALRQSVTSVDRVRQAIDLGAAKHLVIEIGRPGGITAALEILKLCREAALNCTIASRLQTVIGATCDIAISVVGPIVSWQIPWCTPNDSPLDQWPDFAAGGTTINQHTTSANAGTR